MQHSDSTSVSAGCYHIVRWADSGIFCTIALRRCYKSRSAASTARYRGLFGDRSRDGDHLERHGEGNRLAVVRCNPGQCPCSKWVTGCNADSLPERPPKKYLQCATCAAIRRSVVEITDPKDETPRLYCRPCAQKRVMAIVFKGRQPLLRWRHADDAVMTFLSVWQ